MEMFILLLASKVFLPPPSPNYKHETYKVQRSWVYASDFEPFVIYICHSCYRCCCCRRRICVYMFFVCASEGLVHVIIISKSGVVSLLVACERLPCCQAEYVNDNFSFSTMKIVDKYLPIWYDYVSHYQMSVCVNATYKHICANLTFKLFNLKTTYAIRHTFCFMWVFFEIFVLTMRWGLAFKFILIQICAYINVLCR